MKITDLRIDKFMGVNCELQFTTPCNVFLGHNAQGKSAIFDAIQWAFLGNVEHRGVKIKKDAGVVLSTNGCGEARVAIETDLGTITRTRASAKLPPMDLTPEALSVVLNARRVLWMDANQRQKVFGQVFAQQGAMADEITRYFSEHELKAVYLPRVLKDMDAAAKFAREERALAKGRIVQVVVDCEPPSTHCQIDGKPFEFAKWSVDKILDLIEQRTATLADLHNRPAPVDTEKLAIEAADLQDTLDNTDLATYETPCEELLKEKAKREKTYREATTASANGLAGQKHIAGQIEKISALKGKPKCPTCTQDVHEDVLAGILDKLARELTKATAAQGKLDKKKRDTQLAWAQCDEDGKGAREMLEKVKLTIESHTNRINDIEKLIKIHQNAEPGEPVADQVAKLEHAIASYNELLAKVRAYHTAQADYEAKQDSVVKQRQIRDDADKIAQLLKPAGDLRKIAMDTQIEVAYDPVLTDAWGISPELLADGTVELFQRPIELASESERWRAGLILTELLSRESGTNLLMIDGMDLLADTRAVLRQRLEPWCETYETILVNAAQTQRPTDLPPVTGVTYWWVDAGTVAPIAVKS